jgi:hypothetical protein
LALSSFEFDRALPVLANDGADETHVRISPRTQSTIP